jgi:hypothetical protein
MVDLVTNGYTATFASRDIGTNIAVTVTGLTLAGADAANYTLAQPTDLTANITVSALTVTGITAESSKTYDGTTTATLEPDWRDAEWCGQWRHRNAEHRQRGWHLCRRECGHSQERNRERIGARRA